MRVQSCLIFLFWFIIILGVNACTTLSHFQTARTIEPKTARATFGLGYLLTPDDRRPEGVSSLGTSLGELPIVDLAFRSGAQKYLDVGAKVSFPSSLTFDGKYQFLDHPQIAGAIGLMVGYVVFSSKLIEENKGVRNHYLDVGIPFYWSFDFSPDAGIYFNALALFHKDAYSPVPPSKMLGITLGFRLGNTKGVFLEGNYLQDINVRREAIQINIGFFTGTGSSLPDYNKKTEPPRADAYERPITEGSVINYSPGLMMLYISHPAFGNWRVTDRICVIARKRKTACGTILTVSPEEARAKLNFVKSPPLVGARVLLDSNFTSNAGRHNRPWRRMGNSAW